MLQSAISSHSCQARGGGWWHVMLNKVVSKVKCQVHSIISRWEARLLDNSLDWRVFKHKVITEKWRKFKSKWQFSLAHTCVPAVFWRWAISSIMKYIDKYFGGTYLHLVGPSSVSHARAIGHAHRQTHTPHRHIRMAIEHTIQQQQQQQKSCAQHR